MAEFLAYRILSGKLEYKKVPEALRDAVKKILTEEGHPELAAQSAFSILRKRGKQNEKVQF